MADKLVAVRIKQQDNTYSNEIPIGTWAENVAYDNTKNLLQVLGTIDMYKGDVQTQLNALFENFNGIAEDVAGAIDNWITDHMPSWDPETHLDDTLTADNLAPVSSAVPKLIAVNEAEIQGTKMKISTTGQQDLTVLTPNDIDDTLSQQGEAADAKATGEMIMINNAATAGTKIRLVTTNDEITFLTENDIDTTLSVEGAAADAKTTGDTISNSNAATLAAIAPAYSPFSTYAVGNYVNHNSAIYRCITAITTAEVWTAEHWTEVPLGTDLVDRIGDLKESVGYITGNAKIDHWSDNHQYIANNGTSIAIPFTPSSTTSNVRWLVEPCAEGDVFTITATGGNSSRAYCFVDAQGTILDKAPANHSINNRYYVAPTSSAYIIVNDTTLAGSVYKGILCNEQITAAANAINGDLELVNKTNWMQGTINNNSGGDAQSNDTIRSEFIAVRNMKHIDIMAESGYTMMVFCYANPTGSTFISNAAYSKSFDIPAGCNYIRIKIAKAGSNWDLDFVNHVSVVGLYKIELDIKDLQTEQEKITQIANLLDGDDPTAGLEWHTGSIGSTGANDDHNEDAIQTNIRIPNAKADAAKLAGYKGIRVYCNTGYQGTIKFYKDDGSGGSSYSGTAIYNEWTLMVDIPEDALYARFVLRKNDGSNISVSEGDNVKFALVMEVVKTVHANEDFKKAARLNPVIQFMCRDGRAVPTVPPDSIFAIKAAADNGYDRIRFSVRKSMNSRGSDDYTYVCIHDENIKNIVRNRTDGSAVTENIDPDTKTLEELDGYDWGLAYGSQYRGLKTPRLDDCLKYATLYNLKAALDFKWSYLSDTEVDDITTMLAKYGQYEALIMVHPIASKQKFAARIKELSQDFTAETLQEFQSAKTNLSGLLTGKNRVYLFPKNSNPIVPSQDIINFAAANGFDIMTSELSSIAALAAFGFDKGITLFECHNIPNIKETVNAYVNGLVSEELEALRN